MKSMVYGTHVMSDENLTARVHWAIESLTRQPHLLGYVHEAQHCRCRLCNDVGGTQFDPICNVDCLMCCTCSVWQHVNWTCWCSAAPKPCGSILKNCQFAILRNILSAIGVFIGTTCIFYLTSIIIHMPWSLLYPAEYYSIKRLKFRLFHVVAL